MDAFSKFIKDNHPAFYWFARNEVLNARARAEQIAEEGPIAHGMGEEFVRRWKQDNGDLWNKDHHRGT